jgi:hypothetical protein
MIYQPNMTFKYANANLSDTALSKKVSTTMEEILHRNSVAQTNVQSGEILEAFIKVSETVTSLILKGYHIPKIEQVLLEVCNHSPK